MLGLDGRNDLINPCKAFHSLELLLAVQQHHPQPTLEHRAASCAFDIPLAAPNQREQALDRVGRHRGLAQLRRHLQPMER